MSRINKLFMILIVILIMILLIYNYSYKSSFKLRRSDPSIYFNGDIFSEYGAIGNPYMLIGDRGSFDLPREDFSPQRFILRTKKQVLPLQVF